MDMTSIAVTAVISSLVVLLVVHKTGIHWLLVILFVCVGNTVVVWGGLLLFLGDFFSTNTSMVALVFGAAAGLLVPIIYYVLRYLFREERLLP